IDLFIDHFFDPREVIIGGLLYAPLMLLERGEVLERGGFDSGLVADDGGLAAQGRDDDDDEPDQQQADEGAGIGDANGLALPADDDRYRQAPYVDHDHDQRGADGGA